MRKRKKIRRKAPGSSPGTLQYLGTPRTTSPKVERLYYSPHSVDIGTLEKVVDLSPLPDSGVTWINVCGLNDVALLQNLGERFKIHPLTLEDILSTNQRPKIESYDGYLLIVAKMISAAGSGLGIEYEQVSFVIGKNFLLTFQEREGDVFNPVRERIRASNTRIRNGGPDYLAYALIDTMVDHYFLSIDYLSEVGSTLDQALLSGNSPDLLAQLFQLRRDLLHIRHVTSPLREVVRQLERDALPLTHQATSLFWRDVHDHLIQATEMVDLQHEVLTTMLELHISLVAQRTNDIMKVLTILASLFIPLTFIVGVYGMNFRFMPELEWRYGYLAVWIVMIIVSIFMLLYFRRKGWLGQVEKPQINTNI